MEHGELEQHWGHDEFDNNQAVQAATSRLVAILIRFVGEDLSCTEKCRVLERATEELENGLSTRQQASLPDNHGSTVELTNTPILDRFGGGADWNQELRGTEQRASPRAGAAIQETNAQRSKGEISASRSEEGSRRANSLPNQDPTLPLYSGEQDHIQQQVLDSTPRSELVSDWLRRLPA